MDNKNRYISLLYQFACNLSGSSNVPINLEQICSHLGIKIVQKELDRKQAYLVSYRDNYQIIIPFCKQNKFSPWHRFLIAHELAHFFLIKNHNIKPKNNKDYWITEFNLCDYFARVLLLPDKFVRINLERSQNSTQQRLKMATYFSKSAEVTWSTAAHRITDFEKKHAFFRMQEQFDKNNGHCYRINVSTLENKEYQGKIIKNGTKLHRIIEKKLTLRGQVVNFEQDILSNDEIIREFTIFKSSNAATAIRSSKQSIDLAISILQ